METRSRISHPGGLRRPSGMSVLLVSTFRIGARRGELEARGAPADHLSMSLFRSRSETWEPPAPTCEFLVRCAAPTLPALDPFIHLEGAGAIELQIAEPGTPLPPAEVQPSLGLEGDAIRRAEEARHEVWVTLSDAGGSVSDAVLETTRFANELAERADGVVQDLIALRFFGPGGWRNPEAVEDFDVRDHVTIHALADDGGGWDWLHTHGLVKFGRPELEVYDVPAELADGAGPLLNEIAHYLAEGALIRPGDTLGVPDQPISVRQGARRRRDRWHWEATPVLELVDPDGKAGAPRGIGALIAFREA